ncbi:fimbrial protein [Serratia fonticola]|uniref:fimbrial protein n=1 Tax=Serratia fonticola TaxID=47917 RepID=UPI003AAC9BA8
MRLCCFYPVVLLLGFSAGASGQGIDRGHGRVQMNGQVQESACSLHTDDVWQEIVFAPQATRDTYSEAVAPVKDFSVRLVNCQLEKKDGSRWQGVVVTFDGTQDEANDSLFALRGEAEGLALQLTDAHGRNAIPGNTLNVISLRDDDNQLYYRLRLVRNGLPLKEGGWSAALRFMLAYE